MYFEKFTEHFNKEQRKKYMMDNFGELILLDAQTEGAEVDEAQKKKLSMI